MGSKASKKKVEDDPPHDYCGSSSAMRRPAPVEQKTSIYGWGQLKHPVKKQNGPTTKKKKKSKNRDEPKSGVSPTVNILSPNNTNVSKHTQNSGVPVRVLPVPVPSQTKHQLAPIHKTSSGSGATRSNPNLSMNTKILDTPPTGPPKPKRSFINSTPFQPATDDLAQKRLLPLPGSNLSNSAGGKLNSAETSVSAENIRHRAGHKTTGALRGSSTFPSASALMPLPGGPCFYGQYRCFKCKKYWRSSFAQEGISQNCSKCGTSVFPRR